jgi:hypothetical protein
MARSKSSYLVMAAMTTAITALFAVIFCADARAATITVDSLADTGAVGICALRDAIAAANTKAATNGCVAGTGTDTINFSVKGNIALASALPQITDALLTINGPASPGITIDGGGVVQIMFIAPGATVNIDHVTIAHGNSPFNATHDGTIYNAGTLTVTNSTFSENGGIGSGGAIFNDGRLSVTNSTFSANAGSFGGAIASNIGTALSVINSTFSSNHSVYGTIGNFGTLTVTNSTFSSNSSSYGGGIYTYGTATVTDSTFTGNIAAAGGNEGGGVFNAGTLSVTDSTFSANIAGSEGGGIFNFQRGSVTVTNSTFSANNAEGVEGGGGGSDNSSAGGGGTLTFTNSTFSGDHASPNQGGGIRSESGTVTSIKSTVVAASSGGNCSGTIIDSGYNISPGHRCGFSKTGSANNGDGVNPLLSPGGLANNGGPTKTIALLDRSPAIDAIPIEDCTDQASPPNPIITDQRLFPRPDEGEVNCDIGAYEVQDAAFIPFSRFGGGLRVDPDAGVFYLSGGFILGAGGSIDPTTQPVSFSLGSYAVRLPAESFVKTSTGYVYQKTVDGIFLCIFIKFTTTPSRYVLLANRTGGTLTGTTNPMPVTLTVGDNSGSTLMNATVD